VRFQESEAALSLHYQTFDDYHSDFRNHNLFRLIKRHLKGKKILDSGCGRGSFLHFLGDEFETCGLEPNQVLLQIAQESNPKSEIHPGFAEEVDKVFSRKFDTIVMLDVLEHVEDDIALLNLLRPSLSNGGRLVIVVPAYQYLFGIRDQEVGHYRRYGRKSINSALTGCGYKPIVFRFWNMLGYFPYLWSEKVLKKRLETKLRSSSSSASMLSTILKRCLQGWFRFVENNLNLGFGLSILVVAEPVHQ